MNRNLQKSKRKKRGCFRFFLIVILIFAIMIAALAVLYGSVLHDLPDVSDLRSKASQFETLRILDRDENLLYEIVPPEAGRRDYAAIDKISPYVLASVIAVEDQDYYNHPGFDLRAIVRAFFQNAESGTTVSGASTITQQLARNLLLSRDERNERTVSRKIREIILAAEITLRYSKDEILEIYLNENYYGNYAYGIEAAAQTYFKKSAKNLSLGESAFLAGLPQAPGYYDIFNNREAVLDRLKTVLLLTYNQADEAGCLRTARNVSCLKIDAVAVSDAIQEIENYTFTPGVFEMKYPHWVNYVYQELEAQYGADFLYRSGYTVQTTLDPNLQDISENALQSQISSISNINVHNGAVVVLDPQNGDILAMVGSPDFYDSEYGGQINMAAAPRQPGSAIKPLIYAAAFEKGWTPAELIWDVETDFSPTGKSEDLLYSPPYHPGNYDGQFHGPVLAREALASSLNIPAVKALQYVGIYDDPETALEDGFISFAKRFHIDSLNKAGYGLSVALGGGEMTLRELVNAYAVFATGGSYIASRTILRITDHNGSIVYEAPQPPAEKVLNEEYAYQITSILSDDTARAMGFGTGSILNLSYPAAVKTGTTNDYRDNWTVGYNRSFVVGVWVGNADNTPMTGSTGISGAAPVWHDIMESAAVQNPEIRNGTVPRPAGIRDAMICADSGALPDENCSALKWEVFAEYQPPKSQNEGLVRTYYVDTWSGKLVSAECINQAELKQFLAVSEKEAQAWIKNTAAGRQWAEKLHLEELDFLPEGGLLTAPCGYPELEILSPANASVITDSSIDIWAVVNAENGIFEYSLEFALLSDPEKWMTIRNNLYEPHPAPANVASWNVSFLESGDYLLRIRLIRDESHYFEKSVTVRIESEYSNGWNTPIPNEIPHPEENVYIPEGTTIMTDMGEIYIPPTGE